VALVEYVKGIESALQHHLLDRFHGKAEPVDENVEADVVNASSGSEDQSMADEMGHLGFADVVSVQIIEDVVGDGRILVPFGLVVTVEAVFPLLITHTDIQTQSSSWFQWVNQDQVRQPVMVRLVHLRVPDGWFSVDSELAGFPQVLFNSVQDLIVSYSLERQCKGAKVQSMEAGVFAVTPLALVSFDDV